MTTPDTLRECQAYCEVLKGDAEGRERYLRVVEAELQALRAGEQATRVFPSEQHAFTDGYRAGYERASISPKGGPNELAAWLEAADRQRELL